MKKIFLVVGIILLISISGFLINKKITANAIKEKQETEKYKEWLAETCNCVEKMRYFCPDGKILDGSYCINENDDTYSMRLIGCSKYNCSGEIKIWNNSTNKWENETA